MSTFLGEDGLERTQRYADVFNANDITKFLYDHQDGLLSPNYKSESLESVTRINDAVTAYPTIQNVFENIAAINFESKVMQNEQLNALVYFHAPW